ncbi:mandelate racemase/muconate lactonizing enzyme family protein [Saccharopolyspora sp. K220]|uniref:mandelate racemase/muconate lactonizing enzyme family protein n=1 Tax=Saccharopolyspora soli TaxID=2926618 RepID=UPI001F59E205|nr:mandelate racemase/muconate lactonizing enzyme family protein [Saccharopolyspora soli]MCI2423204.1 mandelate racemase/muconate lactonizing enzyme family protein [Saccharopolyspora soli]
MPRITSLDARVVSYRFAARPEPLSLGSALRRDVVLVRVTCEDGSVGYGESFHGHAGSAVAEIVNTTMQEVVVGREPHETVAVNAETFRRFVLAAGMSGGLLLALSGIDIAMWDAWGKVKGEPVHRLLGGSATDFEVYGGGFTLGFQPPDELAREVRRMVDGMGFRAVKLRIGDAPERDLARVRHIRETFGGELDIMVDANLGHRYDVGRLAPELGDLGVGWLEEPYPTGSPESFVALRSRGRVPVAAGENLGGAHEFADWIRRGALDVVQPDVSRVGGITEALRIAALARAAGLRFAPHISHSCLNHAATLHVLSAAGGDGLFEADGSVVNPFRDGVFSSETVIADGRASVPQDPGLGVVVDEAALADYPGERGSPFPRT